MASSRDHGKSATSGAVDLAGAKRACDLLVVNAHLFTMDAERRVIEDGAIAILGKRIAGVGPTSAILGEFASSRVIDAGGAPVHPGFIDCHVHVTLHGSRGSISFAPGKSDPGVGGRKPTLNYDDWLNSLEADDEHASMMLAGLEMIRNGVTCFVDPGTIWEPDAVAAAAAAIGIRGSVSDPWIWDRPHHSRADNIPRAPIESRRSMRLLGGQLSRNTDADALVRGHVTVQNTSTASDELQRAASDLAVANEVAFTQHHAFDPVHLSAVDATYGKHVLRHLDEIGAMSRHSNFVHANQLRDDEVESMVRTGASIVWSPTNYLFYGVGRAARGRMPELLRRGIPIGFGADVAKAWTFADIAWAGYLVARESGDFLTPYELLEMQTITAARALSLDRMVGSIETGKKADVVIHRLDVPELTPGANLLDEFLLASRSRSVKTVIIDGAIVLKDGVSTRVDVDDVLASARASTRRVRERLGAL